MLDYFSKKARGGVVCSNINYQDFIGTAIGIEIIANNDKFSLPQYADDWFFMCEGEDDLELHVNQNIRIYIQVKNQTLNANNLKKITQYFNSIFDEKKDQIEYLRFHIALCKGLEENITELSTHLKELENSKKVYTEQEYEDKVSELSKKYSIPKEILTRLSIGEYNEQKDEQKSFAYFVHNIRQAFPGKNFTDTFLNTIYEKLVYKFSLSRKNRTTMNKANFLEPIEEFIKFEMKSFIYLEYQKTNNGYFKNINYHKLIQANDKIVKKAYWRIWRKWFKYYGLKIILPAPITNYELCPKCKHPLMANLLGINGIACPDCGYFPFMTLILICDCGEYLIIKKQPDLAAEYIFSKVNQFIKENNCRCARCQKDLSEVNLEQRTILVPYPLPMENYKLGEMQKYLVKYS